MIDEFFSLFFLNTLILHSGKGPLEKSSTEVSHGEIEVYCRRDSIEKCSRQRD